MATPEADLIQTFYSAFARGDGDAMAACYAPDVTFEDPAFGELHGAEAGSMWRCAAPFQGTHGGPCD